MTLDQAQQAWLASRVPYQQTEVYRFGNAIVDDWEGRVNAWPLDEGLIDYVDASYGVESDENSLYTANVIANPRLMVDGQVINAAQITPALLSDELQEAGGVEAAASRLMLPLVITLSSSCFGARISMVTALALANVRTPISAWRIAPTATATVGASI